MATTTTRQQMIKARNLIIRKQYDEARQLLLTLDHALANQWLDQLDEVAPDNIWGADVPAARRPQTREERERWLHDHYATTATEARSARVTRLLPTAGVVIMLMTALTAGIGLGAGLFLSGQIVYVPVLSALIIGVIGGLLMRSAVRYGKVRDGLAVVIFSLLTAALLIGSYWGVRYYDYTYTTTQELDRANPQVPNSQLDELLQANLRAATGQIGILGYGMLEAQEGLPIYSTAFTEDEPTLGEAAGYGVIAVEMLLIVLMIPLLAIGQTRKRFCEDSNDWMAFLRMGYVRRHDSEDFMALLHVADYRQAGRLMMAARPERGGGLAIDAARCGDSNPIGYVRLYDHNGKLLEQVEMSLWDYNALIHHI